MKILYISDSSIPSYSANSIHVMKMCQAWAQQGHEVTLLAKSTGAVTKNVADLYKFYSVEPKFKIKIFPKKPFPGSGRAYNFLLPFFCFGKYDLAYTRAIYPAFWYALIGRKIAFEIHEPFDTKSKRLSFVFKFILARKKVIKWVVISSALKDYLQTNFKLAADQIVVAHDGADEFSPDVKAMTLTGDHKIGYVGSLLQGKGMEIIVPLSKLLPNYTFHIVGGNPNEIQKWRSKLDEGTENLIFHGFVSPAETNAFLKSFDTLIAPYQNAVYVKGRHNSNNIAKWMSPLKIFEYMSSGKPIITSDLPVLKEILIDKENAILCNPDHINDWKTAVELLNDNPALAKEIGAKAKEDFVKKHTWYSRAQFILDKIFNT